MWRTLPIYHRATRGFYRRASALVCLRGVSTLLESLGVLLVVRLVEGRAAPEWVGWLLALGGGAVALKFAGDYLICDTYCAAEDRVRRSLTSLVLRMDWQGYLRLRVATLGEFVLHRSGQVGTAVNAYFNVLGEAAAAVVGFFVALAVSPPLTGLVVGILLLVVGCLRLLGFRLERHYRRFPVVARQMSASTQDIFNYLKFVRASGSVPLALRRLDRAFGRYRRSGFFVLFSRFIPFGIMEAVGVCFVTLILAGALRFRWFSLSEGLACLAIFYRLATRFQLMLSSLIQMQSRGATLADLEKHVRVIESQPGERSGGTPVRFERELAFEGVSFGYGGPDSAFSLEDVSFTLERGRCLALVGSSGAGKTTVLDLVTGLLSPTQGRILVDGIDLEGADREAWRAILGIVLQETPILDGTVAENIAWTEGRLDKRALEEAVALANLEPFLSQLPRGLHTRVGHAGLRISGGQRQRLAVARALYRRPALLVLDEPTSSLDDGTEAELIRELGTLKAGRGLILVTHRPRALELADEILRLERGRVVSRSGNLPPGYCTSGAFSGASSSECWRESPSG